MASLIKTLFLFLIGLCTTKGNSLNSASRKQRPILTPFNPIGSTKVNNRKKKKGSTLVEAMVATAVLSLSTVFISESFFISLDSYQYCSDYLNVVAWADDKIWEAQDNLNRFGSASTLETSGRLVNKRKNFVWNLTYTPADDADSLYKIDLVLSWQEGVRRTKLRRSAYAIYEAEK